jgi:hypothetical protein
MEAAAAAAAAADDDPFNSIIIDWSFCRSALMVIPPEDELLASVETGR